MATPAGTLHLSILLFDIRKIRIIIIHHLTNCLRPLDPATYAHADFQRNKLTVPMVIRNVDLRALIHWRNEEYAEYTRKTLAKGTRSVRRTAPKRCLNCIGCAAASARGPRKTKHN